MKKKIIIFIFYLITQLPNNLIAASSTGASFLKIPIGARAISMGRAFTAISDDVSAIHWNPAGLMQLSKKEISAMHTEWLVDTKLDFIGFAFPLMSLPYPLNPAVISGSVIYFSNGDLERRNEAREKTGTFGASDLLITMSYSKQLAISDKRSVNTGINIKLIRQQIESHQATGIAFDIGFLYKPNHLITKSPNNFSIGLSIQNLGPQMKFISQPYNLPLTITTGLGYRIGGLNLSLDVKQQVYEERTIISVGSEYSPTKLLALRLGYAGKLIEGTISNKDITGNMTDNIDFIGFKAGLGLKLFTNYQLDYAFVPYGVLGATHQISFSAKF